MGSRGPTAVTDTSCVLHHDAGPGCVIGGPPCIDGMGQLTPAQSTPCDPSPYCAPASACLACETAGALDPTAEYNCLLDMLRSTSGTTLTASVGYSVATQAQGQPCSGTVTSSGPIVQLANVGCVPDKVLVRSDLQTQWNDTFQVDGLQLQFHISSTCQLSVDQGGSGAMSTEYGALLAINLTNKRGIMLPITIRLAQATPSCATVGAITPALVSTADNFDACFAGPLAPGQTAAQFE
jgi:hypothetical protein